MIIVSEEKMPGRYFLQGHLALTVWILPSLNVCCSQTQVRTIKIEAIQDASAQVYTAKYEHPYRFSV
jgi:hypothetical protein